MNRRNFIKKAGSSLFVPAIFGIYVPSVKAASRRALLEAKVLSAAGGPNTWYDSEIQANTDTSASSSTDSLEWVPVVVAQAGSATKARIYLKDNSATQGLKMGVYANAGGAVLASGSVSASVDDAYTEVTFGTPVAVSAATYLVAWIVDGGGLEFRYKASSGNWKAKLGFGYSSFPGNLPSPDFDLSRGYAAGLFVL